MTLVTWRVGGVVGGALLVQLLLCLTPGSATADIYLKRERFGVLHFTNVPTDKGYRVVMQESGSFSRVTASGSTMSFGRVDSRVFDPIIAAVSARYQMD